MKYLFRVRSAFFVVVVGAALAWLFLRGAGTAVPPATLEESVLQPAGHLEELASKELDDMLSDLPDQAVVDAAVEPSKNGVDPGAEDVAVGDCVTYDVVRRIIDGVKKLDIDKTMQSLQLNPRCIPLSAEKVRKIRDQLEAYKQKDNQMQAVVYAAHAKEMVQLVRSAAIPELTRDLYPEIYDRVLRADKRRWLFGRADMKTDHNWESDKEFQRYFMNSYANELRRSTPYKMYHESGEAGNRYVARYSDCGAITSMLTRGHREILASEVMTFLISSFVAYDALTPSELAPLWARFSKFQDEAMTAKALFIK
jgi:hypothetical protein